MTPTTHLENPPDTALQASIHVETLVLDEPKPKEFAQKPVVIPRNKIEEGSFRSSMIELNRMKSGSRTLDILISLAVNLTLLTGPVFAGLYFTDTLNLKQFTNTFLVAPPPPPPPPPAPSAAAVKAPPAHRVFENSGRLTAPRVIPKNVAEIKEASLAADGDGVFGVPGGVPGGLMGGVLGGVIGGGRSTSAPVAPKAIKPTGPVRVGGNVREPKVITRVAPNYPALARQIHLQGAVVIEAVLDEGGNVVEMQVVSGPPLLIASALEAVRQWKYQPTYLNDVPVAVRMIITVTFTLAQ
jgi:periplasmic protein TonB